jgi:uncharacterized protein (DUF433 family)
MKLAEFLTTDDGGFIHLVGHRIGLNHVIRLYNQGYSPEMLAEEFDTLTLAMIHKVIAFYLENQKEVDTYMAEHDREMKRQMSRSPRGPSLAELRRRVAWKRSAMAS